MFKCWVHVSKCKVNASAATGPICSNQSFLSIAALTPRAVKGREEDYGQLCGLCKKNAGLADCIEKSKSFKIIVITFVPCNVIVLNF